MPLTQYQIDLFWYTESQVEHINWLLKLAISQWENKWIDEIITLRESSEEDIDNIQ